MTRTRTNEKLVVFSRGKNFNDTELNVAVRPSDVAEVMPDPRYLGTGEDWTRIIMRNKSEHVVNHSFADVVSWLNRECEEAE